jgi:hypothetical protein
MMLMRQRVCTNFNMHPRGVQVNGLGLPTAEVPALFTLPLRLCWAYLGATALRLGCAAVARAALAHVLNHFTVRKTPQPLWTLNPFDSLALNLTHVVSFLGDAKSARGDAKSSRGDAKSSLGEA